MRYLKGSMAALTVAVGLGGCGGAGGGSPEGPPPAGAPQNVAPSVAGVPDQTVDEDGISTPIKVVVSDPETDSDALEVSVTAADPMLMPASGIVLGGAGAERTLILVPAAGQTGATDVTVAVTDGDGASTSTSFVVRINPLFRAEFSSWMRDTVLAQGEFDDPVGAPHDDGSPLTDVEDILRIRFVDDTADDPAAYDDLLPEEGG